MCQGYRPSYRRPFDRLVPSRWVLGGLLIDPLDRSVEHADKCELVAVEEDRCYSLWHKVVFYVKPRLKERFDPRALPKCGHSLTTCDGLGKMSWFIPQAGGG